MPSGLGTQPFGISPYGIGTPITAPVPGGEILRHVVTGEACGGRRIERGDYVFDEYGRPSGMPNAHQLVLLAVSTAKGSSAMIELGHNIRSIERITSNIVYQVSTTVRAAVAHIVERGLIEVVDVVVEQVRPGTVRARLRWRDLSSGVASETEIQ